MNDCREIEPLLAPYADGGADAGLRARVDAHVAACDGCRRRMAEQKTICDSLRARGAALRGCASGTLKSRCAFAARNPAVAAGPRSAPIAPAGGLRRWAPLTAAAAVVLAVAAVFGLGLNNKVQALAFQGAVDHAACTRLHLGKGAADAGTVAAGWRERFGWAIRVPESARGDDLELRGIRRCGVTDGRVAHVMYVWRGEPLSLYVLPADVLQSTPAHARSVGHEAVMWSQNGRTYMLVSNRRSGPELDRVVSYVRATAY